MNKPLNDTPERIQAIIRVLRHATKGAAELASAQIVKKYGQDPYLVLTSCLLSLRTRDTVSYPASVRLFELATTPQAMLKPRKSYLPSRVLPSQSPIASFSKQRVDRSISRPCARYAGRAALFKGSRAQNG